jgi:NTP pyrophosphatase (non-canonical NTP hydrolase)
MEFDEYQQLASRTALYSKPDMHYKLMYLSMGIAGETGEVVEKVKKLIRPAEVVIADEKREDLKKEIGDVLWYISQMAKELGLSLEDIAQHNIKKLADRAERGVIHSEGDTR